MSKSSVCWQHSSLSDILMSWSELGVPRDYILMSWSELGVPRDYIAIYSTMHGGHTYMYNIKNFARMHALEHNYSELKGGSTRKHFYVAIHETVRMTESFTKPRQ